MLQNRIGIEFKFLLLDEIDQSLDKACVDAFSDIVKTLQKEFTILVITHNDRLKDKFTHGILVRTRQKYGVSGPGGIIVVKPYLIAITGKQNSGKNTTGKLLAKKLGDETKFIAFADPIKKIAEQAFPNLPKKWLYGPSKFRSQVIPGAFKNGVPLTVRQMLMDIGNDFGRRYNDLIWIDNLEIRFQQTLLKQPSAIIITDTRFRTEFDRLQALGFYQVRILRSYNGPINTDVSEINQDGIQDDEFDAVIDNNGTKQQLRDQVNSIVVQIKAKCQ